MRNWLFENVIFESQFCLISCKSHFSNISVVMKTSLIISFIILGQGLSLFSLLLKVYLMCLLCDRTKQRQHPMLKLNNERVYGGNSL